MNLRNLTTLCPAAMAALLLSPVASALPDHLTVVTTNPHTGAPATLELDRYSLRAPNWEARIYTSPTTYTVLPANQVPEVTTYRGRVAEDGGMVYGGVRPDGTLFAKVNYGCRDSNLPIFSDPYESSNRYSWVISSLPLAGQTVNTGYVYAPAANEPVTAPAPPANWFNNLGATQNFGGPPPYNNMVTMPLNRVRLVCSANAYSLGTYNNSIAYALLGMESAVNQADYLAARDGGVSYQIQASGIQTYAADPGDTSAVWNNIAHDIMCWTANGGVSGGSWVIDFPEDMGGGTMVHELGHSLGGPDFCGEDDYQGSMLNTEHGNGGDEMNGVDLYRCLSSRAYTGYLKNAGYVYYRTPVPTRANQDFVSTSVNTPVSVDVLLNDWNANTTNRADLSIVSFQNPSERGGTVTDLGGGVLRYTPPAGFRGDDVFRYYVSDPSGRFKSLSGVRVLVVDPNNPLIARYPFDETTGVSALDTSGGGRKGTLMGNGSFATDRVPGVGGVGGAIHLSGYAGTWDGSPRLTFGNPFPWGGDPPPDRIASYSYDALDRSQSVSFWYKPDKLPVTGNFDSSHQFHMLYGKHNVYQSNFGDGGGIVIGINNNTLFAMVQMYGPHGSPVTVDSGITPQPGMWYHIVGQIDRENQQVHLYVNGVKHSSAAGALPAGQFVVGSSCANLGGQNQGGHTMYAAPAGAYDDLRIYTKALTSTEVTGLYEAPGMLPASLLAPAAGQTDVIPLPLLSWAAGRVRYQHDVYLGTDAAAVAAATVSTPGIYLGRTANTSLQLTSPLDFSRTYFWRIDEVDGGTIGTGAVWQFTTAVPSPACDLLSFNWGGNVGAINGTHVTLVVPYGTNLATLNPTCTVSPFATVNPVSGSTVDFSNSAAVPVPYTVTAQGLGTKVYHVTVRPSPDILTFTLGGIAGNISGTQVTLVVPYGTDVTALAPTYTVSPNATEDPAHPSGAARNFTTPKTYTIPARDGSISKTYTVTVYRLAVTTGFAGPSLDASLTPTYAAPGTTLTLGGTAAFSGGADGQYRSYVATVGSDYGVSATNWTATIEVFNGSPRSDTSNQGFFGLGTGTTTGPGAPIYGEPMGNTGNQPAAYMSMYGQASGLGRSMGTERKQSNEGWFASEVNLSDAAFDTAVGTTGGVADDAFYRYRMAYDALAQTLTFDVEKISGFGGTVTNSGPGNIRVVSLAGMGYDATNGRIFFGGYNSTFDNLSVIVAGGSNTATTTTVGTSANPVTAGASVTLTATVAPASGATVPTGSVQFQVDGVNVGSPVPVTAGTPGPNGTAALVTTAPAAAGSHTVTANYTAADGFNNSSGSTSLAVNTPTFTTGFAGPSLDPNLTQTYTAPGTTLTVGGTAAFTGGANGQYRSYVATVGSDYGVSPNNWTATIEVATPPVGGPQLFFGLGRGISAGQNPDPWGEPMESTQPAAFMVMYPQSAPRSMAHSRKQANQGYWTDYVDISDAAFDTAVGTTGGVVDNAFYRYSMAYDAVAQTLTFDVDQISGFGGTVTNSGPGNIRVVSLAGMGFDATNGRIFFGGYASTFDNFSVNVAGAGGYAGWATGHAGGGAPDQDFNHDGVSNGIAYFMGMNGLAINPGVVGGKVTWPHVNAVSSFEVQVSDNLSDWSPATSGVDTSDPSKVVFTLPAGAEKKFCRLMVVP